MNAAQKRLIEIACQGLGWPSPFRGFFNPAGSNVKRTRQMSSWEDVAQKQHLIEGDLIGYTRGQWLCNCAPVPTGKDGGHYCLLMDSAEVGEICFENGELVGERTGRVEDGYWYPESLTPGWNPSTKLTCIGINQGHRGRPYTFRSSSWGGRIAFQSLVRSYARLKERFFPVVSLSTAKRSRNSNTVDDPVFVIESWLPRQDFAPGALPPPAEPAPRLTGESVAALEKQHEPRRGSITVTSGIQPPPLSQENGEPAGEREFAPLADEDI
jgi:hypothetical protein